MQPIRQRVSRIEHMGRHLRPDCSSGTCCVHRRTEYYSWSNIRSLGASILSQAEPRGVLHQEHLRAAGLLGRSGDADVDCGGARDPCFGQPERAVTGLERAGVAVLRPDRGGGAAILSVPGVYEILAEEWNNDVLDTWVELNPELAYPDED